MTNPRPWFDRMIATVLTVLVLCFAALMIFGATGCRSLEEQILRDEARAASILAEAQIKAAKLCPSCVFQDTVTTKADSAVIPMEFGDMDYQGMLIQCREALEAARADLRNAPDTVRVPVESLSPRARKAVQAIRANVCQFEPQHLKFPHCTVDAIPGANGPLITHHQGEIKMVCPPCVGKTVYKEAPRVQQWGWIGVLVGLVLGVGFTLFMVWAFKKA